jgi:signal transduction histidine kinase/DNA-binding response OmpR family regulator
MEHCMPDGDKAKILIVDDLPEKHLVYRVILEGLNQEIVAAHGGNEALKQVLRHDFAVILLDVNMPDLDGFETAALIRQRKRSAHTPIIFITAFADEVRAAEGYAHGAVDYILAPVVPEVLRAKVNVFVDLFRMNQQVKRQAEEKIALAEERSRRAAAEEANRRLGFLARVGGVLGKSLDLQVTAADALKLTVPGLADRATIVEYDAANGQWDVGTCEEGSDPVTQRLPSLETLGPKLTLAIERVLATGILESLPDSADPPTTLVLPLAAREHTIAAMVLSREPSGRRFHPADVTMADAMASRTAIAMDNARLYKDLEEADRQKNEFLSMLAHELRNPLAPIRNAVTILRQRAAENPDAARAQDVIDRQVSHLVRLVDDLLDVSRITRGKIQLKRECLDVASVMAAAVETSRPHIEALEHQFTVQMPTQPLYIDADQARIAQVLSNLLNNAAKFTPPGGSIFFGVTRQGADVVFQVRDSGIGIPADMLHGIFDLFTQVERSIERSQGGLGIGLTLAQRIVQMHGGQVEAKSQGLGCGSEFTVRLPAVEAIQTPASSDGNGDEGSVPAGGLRLLVVDDNVDSADSLAWLLRLSGHHTRIAYDGLAALEAARTFRPQAIVLDLGLPGLDGYAVARQLRQEPAGETLLLALSGYGRPEDFHRSREAGFDHHFIKPVNLPALLEALSTAFPKCDVPSQAAPSR